MGVPRLRRHLLPFSHSILLCGDVNLDNEDIECVKAVVIDGPSLVYNVYSRLLSWFSVTDCNMIDCLPTCDEVSQGVMLYLLHLELLGVEILGIYFDGALPARKYETRVARLESQRQRLEVFCVETKNGFVPSKTRSAQRNVRPDHVLCSRPISAKYSNLPANPFMVATAFEDLKYRWSWLNITKLTGNAPKKSSLNSEVFPWASVARMVPGEADTFCANTASLRNACILTNDSDLILHDLGPSGAVILLDSVELIRTDTIQPSLFHVKAAMLRPSLISQRLGLPSLLPLGYQLKARPEIGLIELLHESKHIGALVGHLGYENFAIEYRDNLSGLRGEVPDQGRGFLDTRLSELVWQYELPSEYATKDHPHVYLPLLVEDHTRRCAWDQGRDYRSMAYSLLNVSHPPPGRSSYVIESIRRGQRVVEDRLQLQDESGVSAGMRTLGALLQSLQTSVGSIEGAHDFWTITAIRIVYGADSQCTKCGISRLEQFLRLGYMGKRLEWADIHLTAQTHAVLYSLRVLKQILDILQPEDAVVMRLHAILADLPPLHVMMRTRQCGVSCTANITAAQLSAIFELRAGGRQSHRLDGSREGLNREHSRQRDDDVPSRTSNIYELLQEQ